MVCLNKYVRLAGSKATFLSLNAHMIYSCKTKRSLPPQSTMGYAEVNTVIECHIFLSHPSSRELKVLNMYQHIALIRG